VVNGNVTEVYLDLLSLTKVAYHDNRHVGDNPEEVIDTDELRQATTDWLTKSLTEKVDFCDDEGLRILGRHLYHKVFRGAIADMFDETYEYFESATSDETAGTLRVVITFHQDAEDLAALPWEFLYYAKKGTFLSGGKHQLVLTRMVQNQPELKNEPPAERKLRVLAAVCTPDSLNSGIERENVEKIAAAMTEGELADAASKSSNTKVLSYLQKLHLAQQIELTILTDPEFSQLETAVREDPNIIHFIGHGAPGKLYMRRPAELVDRDRANYYLAQSAGQPAERVAEHESVDASKVETLFRQRQPQRQPRLVFLQACYGATVGRGVAFSTALEIVKVGVPAVVAMQYDIDAGSVDEFALAFYKKLMSGGTIADAVSEGRQRLATQGEGKAWAHRNFGTPVIYMHGDTVVVGPPAASGRGATGSGAITDQGARTPAATPERTCKRCGREHCKYFSCPACRLHFYCQCAKNPAQNCDCQVELEEPQNGWCGFCEHETQQPLWEAAAQAGGPEPAAAAPGLRPVPRAPDSFEAAS
jgi:hypothetical protein